MSLLNQINRFIRLPFRLFSITLNKMCFASFGRTSSIRSPLRIDGAKNIFIGNNVTIQYKTWLGALPLTIEYGKAELIIEDGSIIGNFNHIFATNRVLIHKNVLTADKVFISDNIHGYENIDIPILRQPIVQNGDVEIGEGTWLGENVCVLGVHIGKHCVIGANSVVTKDIPDYSVAVGTPAKVIKQYNNKSKKWEKV